MSDAEKPVESKEERAKSRYQKIQDMAVPEQIKLAMTGDKEARTILFKIPNKQVQEAVLNSPRITEIEIVAIANSRSTGDELLRKIAANRQWMKNYQLRLALVNNPRTPVPIGMKLVGGLVMADLKRLSKNKGVSNALVSMAQRTLIKKGQR
ncbi:MAG: hypothetical protein JSU72_08790 [Deltaproteobacteria bacterium]|nr:MAG: hypothetical protein JSU72_08790 [Deltaproteobacteria bacterium]